MTVLDAAIGDLALVRDFTGALRWGFIDRVLWMNPPDHQGTRFLMRAVRAGEPWREDIEEW